MTTQTTGVFDVAAGADEASLNAAIAAIYQAVPSVFTQTFNINTGGMTTVVVDFQVAPTLQIAATDHFRAEASEFAARYVPTEQLEQAVSEILLGSLPASCSQVSVTINGSAAPTVVTASVTCGASFNPVATGLQLFAGEGSGVITVPNEPEFSTVLTNLVAPQLIDYLNGYVLPNIIIPPLSVHGVTLAVPVIVEESAGGDNFMVFYTGLNPVTAPDPGMTWPTNETFVAVDGAAIGTLLQTVLPQPSGSGGTSEPNFSWGYNVTLGVNSVTPQPGSTELDVNLSANASANFTFHTPDNIPNISFGGTASGSATANTNLSVVPDNGGLDLDVTITGVGDINLSISIDGIPSWLEPLFDPIIDIFSDEIGNLIISSLNNTTFTAFTINPIVITFASTGIVVNLQNANISSVTGPGGLPMVMVTATPAIASGPTVEITKSKTINARSSTRFAAKSA